MKRDIKKHLKRTRILSRAGAGKSSSDGRTFAEILLTGSSTILSSKPEEAAIWGEIFREVIEREEDGGNEP